MRRRPDVPRPRADGPWAAPSEAAIHAEAMGVRMADLRSVPPALRERYGDGDLAVFVWAYRLRLLACVTQATPLVTTLAREELNRALEELIGPVVDGGRLLGGGTWKAVWLRPLSVTRRPRRTKGGGPSVVDPSANFMRTLRAHGVVIRPFGHALGGLGLKVVGGELEMAVATERSVLVTRGGRIRIEIAGPISLTVAAAAKGRPLSGLLSSPLFDGRDYPITDVVVRSQTTLITAETGSIPFRMPWDRPSSAPPSSKADG